MYVMSIFRSILTLLSLPVYVIGSGYSYEDYTNGNQWLSLQPIRSKRQTNNENSDPGLELIEETKWGNGSTTDTKTVDHRYYTVITHKPSEDNMNKYWINVPNNNTNSSYKQLANSYRRAVSTTLSFEFPFYGHLAKDMTIATGGFCYVGDHMHSWLAATQYIAPFMANFDTTPSDANIWYIDTGDVFVVQWDQVVVRHQKEAGSFTFQCSLHKNGDIWFVYKNIATPAPSVSDAHHPLKSGLSDAYLFEHNAPPMSKKIIYEYHRIQIDMADIKNFTVIEIKANPVCIAIKTCEECSNATLAQFNCSWCSIQGRESFCSDEEGLHRRRQDWINGKCKEKQRHAYCHADESKDSSELDEVEDDEDESNAEDAKGNAAQVDSTSNRNENKLTNEYAKSAAKGMTISKQDVEGGNVSSGSMALLVIMLVCSITLIAWIVYAYYNPHTASGQLLIRYRPRRWRLGGDHSDVRYTASVHM